MESLIGTEAQGVNDEAKSGLEQGREAGGQAAGPSIEATTGRESEHLTASQQDANSMPVDSILAADDSPTHDIDFSAIPEVLKKLDRWICWEWRHRSGKWSKVPIHPNGYTISVTDPTNWSDFETVAQAAKNRGCGLGFCFNGDGLIGIDIDDCRDPITGDLSPFAAQLVRDLKTYWETSPSETGVKGFVFGELPEKFVKKHELPKPEVGSVEIYREGRFFAVTGQRTPGASRNVEERATAVAIVYEKLLALKPVKSAKPIPKASLTSQRSIADPQRRGADDDRQRVPLALAVIPNDDYELWLQVGMALHSLGNDLLSDWVNWSRSSEKFEDGESEKKWSSFGRDGLTIATLFKLADETGRLWRPSYQPESQPQNGNSVNCVYSVYASEEWPEPIRLGGDTVADFPIEAIPEPARGYLQQLAEFTQTPPDLACGMFLATVAVAVQKKFEIEPSSGWTEPLNIYIVSLMEPANRKSAVVSKIASPIRRHEAELLIRTGPSIRSAKSAFEVRAKQRLRLVEEAAKAISTVDRNAILRDLEILDEEISDNPIPSEPRLLVDDITPEHMATKMAQNNGKIGVLTAEGDFFDIIAGRYSSQPNLGILLKAHCGDDARVDRGNRPSEHIQRPALTIGCCVQPEVIRGLQGRKEFRGRGALARLCYQYPKSLLGSRKTSPEAIDAVTEASYGELIQRLLDLPVQQQANGEFIPEVLTLSRDADSMFREFREEIELCLGDFGSLATIRDWGGKLPGAVARIAGLLHLAESSEDPQTSLIVSETTIGNAIWIGRYLISHANAAFQIMGNNESMILAEHISATLKRHGLEKFTKRDLHQHVRRHVKQPDDLDSPLRILVDHNHIRELVQDVQGRGRKPSPAFEVNPKVLSP